MEVGEGTEKERSRPFPTVREDTEEEGMIIHDDNYEMNGGVFCRAWSDAGLMLRKVGTDELYSEAVDVKPCRFEYEETDTPVEGPEEVM